MVQTTATDIGSNGSGVFMAGPMIEGDIGYDRDMRAIRVGDGGTPGGQVFRTLADTQAALQPLIDAVDRKIQPFGVATVAGIVNGRTRLQSSFSGPAFVNGGTLQLYVDTDITGPVDLKTDQTGDGYLRVTDRNNAELSGVVFPAGSFIRLTINLNGAIWNVFSVTPSLQYSQGIATDALGAKKTIQGIYKLPIGLPIGGNVNNIGFNDFPAPADQTTFEVIVAQANTGATFIFANGPYLRIAHGGSGSDVAPGELVAGTAISLTRSDAGGGIAVLNGSRPLLATAPPVGSQDASLANQPWGNVTNTGSGGSTATPRTAPIVVIGSSNAASAYVADGSRPDQFATAALNDLFVGDGVTFPADLQAVQGAPWSSASGQLQASSVFMSGAAKWVLPFFWMNDCRSIFYHDNGGVIAQFNALIGIIDYIRSMGAEPVLSTGFHADPRANPSATGVKALDPFYFSDATAYPTGGTTRDMVYPTYKAKPVSPTADMVPKATLADFMVSRDWTGGGVVRTGYKRIWHFNRTLREIATAKNCVILDLEWSSFRTCIETVPDLGAGLDTFYDVTNPLHPKAALYQAAVKPVINQWARSVAEGRNDIRVFRGV